MQKEKINHSFYLCLLVPFFCLYPFFSLRAEIPDAAFDFFPPMDQIYHPVSTNNPLAQKSFDKGLTYIFAFNHDLAFKEFENASKLDPNLAMAYWGMALALGQNVNDDVTPERELKAYHYIQKALELSKNASLNEKAYIQALSSRYTNQPGADLIPLRYEYRTAMKKVTDSFPEDLDAATLYAESILDLDPWKWWTPEGKAKEGIYEAIDALEFVLNRNPDHIGANHFYIHAFEESPFPERALMSAYRLESLMPTSGHLLHMPCHIFILVGDYKNALATNKKAIDQDWDYIKRNGITSGSYPLHYLGHNLYILARIYMLMEDYPNALNAANDLANLLKPHLDHLPHAAYSFHVPLEIYLYFHKWKEILDYTIPIQSTLLQPYLHFSRGMAFVGLGDLQKAEQEKQLLRDSRTKIPKEDSIANNPAEKVYELAQMRLEAALAHLRGNENESINLLRKAANFQESLEYDEPPPWYIQIRQELGFALLRQKDYQNAQKEFLLSLDKLKRNGRNLYGLFQSLKNQNIKTDAYWILREMDAALQNSSRSLNLNDL